jgi:hypothetical protein
MQKEQELEGVNKAAVNRHGVNFNFRAVDGSA